MQYKLKGVGDLNIMLPAFSTVPQDQYEPTLAAKSNNWHL